MHSLIVRGRQHRFLGAAAHMAVFLVFYLLCQLVSLLFGDAILQAFYPLDWVIFHCFTFIWNPIWVYILIIRLLNCNLTAACLTGSYFLGLLLSVFVYRLTDDGSMDPPMTCFWVWMLLLLIAGIVGIVLDVKTWGYTADNDNN